MCNVQQEEHEIAYQAALAAGQEPNGTILNENDPNRISVVRWVMNNAHCGWLIGKGGSGIQNIEVCVGGAYYRLLSSLVFRATGYYGSFLFP